MPSDLLRRIYEQWQRFYRSLFGKIIILIIIFILIGTFGFYFFERSEQSLLGSFTLLDSFYWTIITITTIGFGDIAPLTPAGQGLAILLAFFGVALISTTFAIVSLNLIESRFFEKRKYLRMVKKMDEIILVCGFNERIRILVQELSTEKIKVVLVNKTPIPDDWDDQWGAYIQGDPTEDQTLLKAGIEKARKALISLDDDGDSLLAVLSIQSLNKYCYIIAEVKNKSNLKHYQHIKCHQTICQEEVLGKFLNISLLLPELFSAYYRLISMEGPEIHYVKQVTDYLGQNFEDVIPLIKEKYDALLIGLLRQNQTIINPPFNETIQENDKLIVISDIFLENVTN